MPMTLNAYTPFVDAAPAATASTCCYGSQEPWLDGGRALAGRSMR